MRSTGKDRGSHTHDVTKKRQSLWGRGVVARAQLFPTSAPSPRPGPPVFPSADPSFGWKGDGKCACGPSQEATTLEEV